jgi:flagellar M-ring protein FliF
VTADVDFTQTEQTREDFDPQQQVVRSEQQSTDQRMAGDLAMGIPGALSNQPPETTPAPPAARQQPANAATQPPQPVATSQRATRNYEIDRTISHVRQPTGTVRRLSVAVILDNKSVAGAEGAATTSEPLTQQEIDKYTSLVKDAVGFDEQRGDRVQIINAAFSPPATQGEGDAEPWWQAPWLKDLLRQGVAIGLVLVLAFVVLRPIVRNLLQGQRGAAAGGGLIGMSGDLAHDRVTLSAGGQGGVPGANYEQQIAAARSLVGQDPRRAAQVVKEWVSTDGR